MSKCTSQFTDTAIDSDDDESVTAECTDVDVEDDDTTLSGSELQVEEIVSADMI
jgi:hypothetical protein